MLPRLRAAEEIADMQIGHAFTERPMSQHARGQYVGQLEQQRSGEGPQRRRLNSGDLAAIAGMGVVVRRQGQEDD